MDIKKYIEEIPMWADKKNSLIDIREYLSIISPEKIKSRIIHVAGTNGKGSVCAYLTKILLDMGFSVGTFISPHLVAINERILLNNIPIEDADFEKTALYIREISYRMILKGFKHPTYFEFLFYMAIEYFNKNTPDFIILETGLGGRLDATNSIDTVDLSIITSISMDHTQYLGDTIEKIAYEKAGIIKNAPVVFDDNNSCVNEVIKAKAASISTSTYPLSDMKRLNIDLSFLNAQYKIDNALLAIYAIKLLGFEPVNNLGMIIEAVKNTVWNGRMQELYRDVFLDGAHNYAGIKSCLSSIENITKKRNKRAKLLISFVGDKDFKQMSEQIKKFCIKNHVRALYIAKLNTYRAIAMDELKSLFYKENGLELLEYDNVLDAFSSARKDKRDDEILFCVGSLYLVSEILGGVR